MNKVWPSEEDNVYLSPLAARDIRLYYARAMDGIPLSEILEDDRILYAAMEAHGFTVINPYRKADMPFQDAVVLIKENLELLRQSNVVIVDLSKRDYQYIGALFEIAHSVTFGKPVIVCIGSSDLDRRFYLHHYADFMCRTVDEAMTYIWRCCSLEGICEQIQQAKTFYDHIALTYQETSRKTYQEKDSDIKQYEKERTQLKANLSYYCRSKSVLELGCGVGDWTKVIADVADSVTCIDASQTMIHRAKEKLSQAPARINFIEGDFLDETLNITPCDVVVSYFALSFLPPIIQYKYLSNIKLWLKNGGRCLFAESTKIATLPSVGLGSQRLQRRLANGQEYLLYKEHFTAKSLEQLLNANGFKIVDLPQDVRWFSFCSAIPS